MERTQVDNIVEIAAELAGKADRIEEVLVIYTMKDENGAHSLDNQLTVETGVYLCELFKNWLLRCVNSGKSSSE
jgi:hypothetical protein